jgi:PEP-CTERM motif
MKSRTSLRFRVALAFATALLGVASATSSHAAIIASETFDGYNFFPDYPVGDPTNLGVPLVAENADSGQWMAARIGATANVLPNGDNSVGSDVGVQREGGDMLNLNNTPVGRFADDVGLVMKLDLTAYQNVVLDFDWRMHGENNTDRFRMAYFQGNEYLGNELGSPNNTYNWFSDPNFGNGGMTWYTNEWTELVNVAGATLGVENFTSETLPIPGGDIVYLLFWLDNSSGNGNFDLGKIDNVVVTGDLIVPEPASIALVGLGLVSIASLARRRHSR